MVSHTVVWVTVGIVTLIVFSAVITYAILVAENARGTIGPSSFKCSLGLPAPFPACKSSVITSGVHGLVGSGFFTNSNLIVMPSVKPTLSITPTPPMTGYYHSHPTGYFVDSPVGALYSYPFVLKIAATGPPSLHLAAARYASAATEVSNSPFDQFSYLTADGGYDMSLVCAIGTTPLMPGFTVDREPYPTSGGPTLSSMLSSIQPSPGTRKARLVTTQGTPYIMLICDETPTAADSWEILSISDFTTYSTTTFLTAGPPSRTFNAYIFWKTTQRCIVWYIDSAISQNLSIVGSSATLSISTPTAGSLQGIVYISMFADVGSLLSSAMQLIANSLEPYFIRLEDIIPTSANTAMQYTIVPIPSVVAANGNAGNATLWIVPPTSFEVTGLGAITLADPAYLDFPLGNGLFQTGTSSSPSTSFFTLWPPAQQPLSDFSSYVLPNSGGGLQDTSHSVSSDADLYYLALAIRVLFSNPGGQAPTNVQINAAVSTFISELNGMGVGEDDHTLFTETLAAQDAGLVSRVAYLLLSFVHLRAVNGLMATSGSNHGWITNAAPLLTTLIESGLTTATLSTQAANSNLGVGVYASLSFLDTYTCTVPVIKTVGYTVAPSPTLAQLSSRLGEVLGWLWASDFLVSNGFVTASSRIPVFSRCLYSITLEATSRLLRGQCAAPSIPSLSPVMPWTSLISQTSLGFQLDGASPGGTSPDAVIDQTFTPFSPASHHDIRPLLYPLALSVEKLLKCSQAVPQASPATFFFGGYVDPQLVSYFTYLYTSQNCSNMLLTGNVDENLKPFIKSIALQHPSVALMMNQVKLGLTSQVLVTQL